MLQVCIRCSYIKKSCRYFSYWSDSGSTFYSAMSNCTTFRMNEQPSMKLMFNGCQGDFPDKSFCKLSRRGKCKNEQSAITLPCLPVFFAQYNLYPTWAQVRINFCSNWAEVGFGTSAQFGWRCISFYSQLGNNFAPYHVRSQIGKQCKPVQVHLFTKIPPEEKFSQIACWGSIPNPF